MVTRPSAGATMKPGPLGVTRTGSRKKPATQMVTPTMQPGEGLHAISAKNRARTAAMTTIFAAVRMNERAPRWRTVGRAGVRFLEDGIGGHVRRAGERAADNRGGTLHGCG